MNIFYLDEDIETCARYHCDKHVIKMILESAQILCTVLWMQQIVAPYKPSHQNHPCVIWANESLSNWYWLKDLTTALNKEYKYRFHHNKNHKSFDIILTLPLPPISDLGLTNRPQVMPLAYTHENIIIGYRQYYVHGKSHIAHWTNRPVPDWFLEMISVK